MKLFLASIFIATACVMANAQTAKSIGAATEIYAGPGFQYERTGIVLGGDLFKITGRRRGPWYPMKHEGETGWVHGNQFKFYKPDGPLKWVMNSPSPSRRSGGSRRYYRGPRGGCYYLSGGGKVYVNRSLCN